MTQVSQISDVKIRPRSPAWDLRVSAGLVALALAFGLLTAQNRAWVSDDAFISFRYADNLVNGLGLVFNADERVEGYSNFLWTLWCAAGLRLGADAERWSVAWGLVFYAGSILLLAWHHWRRRKRCEIEGFGLPIAALLAAAHPDWQIYATGGLESSLFTFLGLAGYVLLVDGKLLAAGLILSLAALTRPDGAIFAAMGGLYVLLFCRPFLRSAIRFGIPCILVLLPFELWRFGYYGDWVPNTYYAKSANLA